MDVLNRNQRASALWRLSGLYAATMVIMGIIVFQAWKSYQKQADAKLERFEKALTTMQTLKAAETKQQAENLRVQEELAKTQAKLNQVQQTKNAATNIINAASSLAK
jgi:hypothetical protein